MRGSQGFTVTELVVASAITALVAIFAGRMLVQSSTHARWAELQWESTSELNRAVEDIVAIGRFATQPCSPVGAAPLQCMVDFSAAPTDTVADDTPVRFRMIPNAGLRQERQILGNWETVASYPSIYLFEVCEPAGMAACSIPEASLSTTFAVLNAAVPLPGRFYRFRLGAKSSTENALPIQLQSAFFSRHPAPGNMRYVWGARE